MADSEEQDAITEQVERWLHGGEIRSPLIERWLEDNCRLAKLFFSGGPDRETILKWLICEVMPVIERDGTYSLCNQKIIEILER